MGNVHFFYVQFKEMKGKYKREVLSDNLLIILLIFSWEQIKALLSVSI